MDSGAWMLRQGRVWTVVMALVLTPFALTAQEVSGSADGVAGASESGVVLQGRVTAESTGEDLSGVLVELVELKRQRLTDARGRFAFGNVPAGTYTLRFQRMGLTMIDRTVNVRADRPVMVEVALGDDALALPPVLVMTERTRMVGDPSLARQIPGSAHVITREEMEAAKLPFDDVGALLRRVPGVNVQEEEGYGRRPNIGMRGTGTERSTKVTIMEDGVLIAPAPYASPAAYIFPSVGRMEAVEVRKGSSQVKYGPRTVGGALNLVTANVPSSLRVELDAAGGQDASGKLLARVGDSYRHGGWLVETHQLRTDGFKEFEGPGDTGFESANYMAKLRLNTDREATGTYQELELKLNRYDEVANETYLGLTDEDFRTAPLLRYAASREDVITADASQVQLRHFVRPNRWLDLTTVAYRNDFFREWYKLASVNGQSIGAVVADPGAYPDEMAIVKGANSADDALVVRSNHREYYAQGIQSALGLRFDALGARHDVEVGLRLHEDAEDRIQHDDAYRMASGDMELTRAGARGTQANRLGAARARAFFIQDHLTMGRFTLTPGVRHESIDFTRTDYVLGDPERIEGGTDRHNSVDAWIPGVAASVLLNPTARVFAGVHRGFGPPGPGANEETKAEASTNYELGTDVRLGASALQLIGFYSDYTNILGAATLSSGGDGSGTLHNGGAVEVFGIEAVADADLLAGRFPGTRLPARLAYTWTHAEFQTAFTSGYEPWSSVEAGDRLPYLPQHQLHASLGLDRDAWQVRAAATYNDAMRTRAGQGALDPAHSTDSFLVLNLSGEYAATPWGTLYATVQNITDNRYIVARQPAGARPGLPRTVQVGVRVGN